VTVRRDVTADELEILLERGKRKFSDWELSQEIEKEARYKTWLAYRKRNVGRLFPVGPHEGREKRHWQAMEAMWYGKAIGCVAVLEEDMSTYSYEEAVLVGVFLGVNGGFLGPAFTVGHFTGPGSSTCRSPLNVGFVHVLGGPFQKVIDARYFTDDDDYEED
jgi:hypothetical protein